MLLLYVDKGSVGDSLVSQAIDRTMASGTSGALDEFRFDILNPCPPSNIILFVEIAHLEMPVERLDGEDVLAGQCDKTSVGLLMYNSLKCFEIVQIDNVLLLVGVRADWADLRITRFTTDCRQSSRMFDDSPDGQG
jgi:hypothetical protein